MRSRLALAITVGVLAGASARLLAHHSFAAVYLEDQMIEIAGEVTEFRYENPHAWLLVRGAEAGRGGGTKVYAAEWVGTAQLERQYIEKFTLKPGDKVRIWGSPAKEPSDAKLHLKKIERNDGWSWQGRQTAR
jgi:hypothetical protein